MGRVCLVKKKKSVEHCSARLFGVAHFCLCIEGNETEVVPVKIMTHVLHYTALCTCMQMHKWASSTVQVVGKFWSLHNSQKLCMYQISCKNYILDFTKDYLH